MFLMTSWKRQVPRSTKWCLRNQNYDTRKNWKYLHNGRPRNGSREKTKAASARLCYSMLKSTLFVFQNVDISRFSSLTSFLKTKCRNYQSKKATTFSRNDVCKFLLEAADQEWILQKVVLYHRVLQATFFNPLLTFVLMKIFNPVL
jgi:hypothetical protein